MASRMCFLTEQKHMVKISRTAPLALSVQADRPVIIPVRRYSHMGQSRIHCMIYYSSALTQPYIRES